MFGEGQAIADRPNGVAPATQQELGIAYV
jgi:hypothetical protein